MKGYTYHYDIDTDAKIFAIRATRSTKVKYLAYALVPNLLFVGGVMVLGTIAQRRAEKELSSQVEDYLNES